jgi:hypothetical protein
MTERVVTPINEVDINIQDAADALFLGPQAELLEKVQMFNSRYNMHGTSGDVIQINRNYGFKPGVYDRIKEAYGNHCLGYKSKPKDIWSLKYRMDRDTWKQRTFWRDAIAIQNKMKSLKYDNVGWQDNVEVVERFFSDLQNRIPSEIQSALSVFENDDITVGIEEYEDWGGMRLVIELFTADIDMQVFHQSTNGDEEIANYKWGNMATRWYIPFWKFVNNWCEGGVNSRYNSSISNPCAKLYPKYPKLRHPYVSNQNYSHNNNTGWQSYTCTGDMQGDLKEAAWSLDINALCSLTRTWLSRYHIPRTNPLNRIQWCYYGWENGMDAKMWTHRGVSAGTIINDCQWPGIYNDQIDYQGENPCDNCQFLDGYAYLKENDSILEDAEYPKHEVVAIEPCHRAIRDYETPLTDEDIIKEACILHIICCSTLRNMPGINDQLPALDYMLSDNNRFPADANLETIYNLNPDFNLDNAIRSERSSWPNHEVEDLLDTVFDTRIWHDLVNDYIELHGIDDESEVDDIHYDLRHESLDSIRNMISSEIARREGNPRQPAWDPLAVSHEDGNLTPEELTIRWATERGRTINI